MRPHPQGYTVPTALTLCVGLASAPALWAQQFIVRQGQANAEIIIAQAPPRATRLAAQELQTYVEALIRRPIEARLTEVCDLEPVPMVYCVQSTDGGQKKF